MDTGRINTVGNAIKIIADDSMRSRKSGARNKGEGV